MNNGIKAREENQRGDRRGWKGERREGEGEGKGKVRGRVRGRVW